MPAQIAEPPMPELVNEFGTAPREEDGRFPPTDELTDELYPGRVSVDASCTAAGWRRHADPG